MQIDPNVARMLESYKSELNQAVARSQWNGMAVRELPDPRVLANEMSTQLDNLVRPMQRMEQLVERVSLLETVALQLYVSLAEALESGKASTPYEQPRQTTFQDMQNWKNALRAYQEYIERSK